MDESIQDLNAVLHSRRVSPGLHRLSDIRTLLPRRECPFGSEAEAWVARFAQRWDIKPPHFHSYNTMSRFLYPEAVSARRLQAIGAVHSMFFFIDDLFFDTDMMSKGSGYWTRHRPSEDFTSVSAFLVSLMDIFDSGRPPIRPTLLQQAFAELGLLVREQSNEAWFATFSAGVRDYLDAVIHRQAVLQDPSNRFGLGEFLDLRARDTGGLHTCQLIELGKDAFLPVPIRDEPQIRRLTELAYRMASFVNDIFSYHKEISGGEARFNLLRILIDEGGNSFDQAVDRAVRFVNAHAQAFIEARAKISSWGTIIDLTVDQYLDGLTEMMSGNVYWHAFTPRYRSPDSPFPELMDAGSR